MKELVAEKNFFRKKKSQDKMLKKGGDRESQVCKSLANIRRVIPKTDVFLIRQQQLL